MKVKINGKIYEANPEDSILDVCRREGIRIPTLCAHQKFKREAACRLCLVETNLNDKLVPSCALKVCENLEVITESEKITKARNINMELLWSDHAGKCVKCRRNRHCELQNLAEEYKIDNFHFVPRKEDLTNEEELDLLKDNRVRVVVDDKNPAIHRTTEFCVECKRCVNICPTKQYGYNHRAGDIVVGTPYNKTLDCIFCGACVKHCPTAALTDKNDLDEIIRKLDDLKILAVAIVDPAVMESVGHEIPEINSENKLLGVFKSLGFERVFSLGWGLEKYVSEIFKEFESDKKIFSSHCPAFRMMIEKYYPELKNKISAVKNPDELMAQNLKTEFAKKEKIDPEKICLISISSCVAKKAKKSQNLDYILTVRELGRLARKKNLDAAKISTASFDPGFSFNAKYLEILKSGGLANILKNENSVMLNNTDEMRKVLEDIKNKKISYDFVEGMICPGGCGHGGGQSIKISNSPNS
jgi:iron only hydrogenase large subunit-like protein